MKIILSSLLLVLFLTSCSHLGLKTVRNSNHETSEDLDFDPEPARARAHNPGKVVSAKDTKTMEDINKAMEAYINRKDSKDLTKLCQDLRFDCYVDNKVFPAKRKKVKRSIPPFATGSKLGLHGEDRVQVRYEFFP